jgi:hypothetical protein
MVGLGVFRQLQEENHGMHRPSSKIFPIVKFQGFPFFQHKQDHDQPIQSQNL